MGMKVEMLQPAWVNNAQAEGLLVSDNAWFAGMDWMKRHTPEPGRSPLSGESKTGPFEAETYGVFSGWDHGNFIAWQGKRLPTASRYPTPYDARWLTATQESEADSLLCPSCQSPEHVRYVAISWREPTVYYTAKVASAGKSARLYRGRSVGPSDSPITLFDFGSEWEEAMATRLTKFHGSGLSHYRLVWESNEQRLQQKVVDPASGEAFLASDPLPDGVEGPPTGNQEVVEVDGRWIHDVHVVPSVRLYEVVRGALIAGTTAPGARVEAANLIHVQPHGRDYLYTISTLADENGEWSLTLPYPRLNPESSNPDASIRIGTQRPWQFTVNKRSFLRRIDLSADQVQLGDTLTIGRLPAR